MTQTAWAHLPNAKHIDWAIDSVKAHPEKWNAAWYATLRATLNADLATRRNAATDAAYYAATDAAYYTATDAAYYAARDAILALIAYDDCAYMIESKVDELKIIAKLGDQRAILLLPACIAYNETKELTNTSIAV